MDCTICASELRKEKPLPPDWPTGGLASRSPGGLHLPAAKPGRRAVRRCRSGLPCRWPRSSWMAGASASVLARGQENGASRLGVGGYRNRIGGCAAPAAAFRMAFPQGLMVRERPRHEGRGCAGTLAAMPYRAFGEVGRSPPRHEWLLCHDRPCGGAARPCRASGYAGPARVHHGSAKVCTDPLCRFHTPGPARDIRLPSGIEPRPAEPSSTCRRVPSAPVPHACAGAPQGRWRASKRLASRRTRRGCGHPPR